MKKNALVKLLAVSVAATLMFTGCGDNSTSPSNSSSTTTESTAKTTESTAKTTESKEEKKESAATTKADVTVNDLDKTVYVTKLVNARVRPTGNADKAGILKKGAEVKVTGITEDEEWYRIDLDGTEAYCQVANFSDEAPAQ